MNGKSDSRLIDIQLDETTAVRRGPDIEHERRVAVYDLLQGNFFAPASGDPGPYTLQLSIRENRLLFHIHPEGASPLPAIILSLTPFRKIIKDYFIVCESYYDAIRSGLPSRIEAIDVGRRALHNEGCQLLISRLEGKITLDADTARRLFTLICVLHIKG